MDIFLSWSGTKSKAAAIAFKDWLPNLITSVEPWLSSEDIDAGRRWPNELQKKLECIDFGVLFVTRNNQKAPWLTFEAGCLSKSIENGVVCPILLDLQPGDIEKTNPLTLFQSKLPDKEGILAVVKSINKSQKEPIKDTRLISIFEKWWPDFESRISDLPEDPAEVTLINNQQLIEERDFEDDFDFCYEIAKNLRDFTCLHQGSLIEYIFMAGEHHKELKREFYKKKKVLKNIIQKNKDLMDHLNESFKDVVGKSFDEIQKMYNGRHIKAPRVCLKATLENEGRKIIVLFRETRINYDSDCNVNENTGFQFIKENGVYYLCQNIPEEANKGEYVNPRLIKDKVIEYMNKIASATPNGLDEGNFKDDEWTKCWRGASSIDGNNVKQHYRNCYKSTLIIPLTLWNNKLGHKFLLKFNMKNFERTIFGYLCFDHIVTDFFDPVLDVDTGYVYADLLSLYLLVRIIFVDQSNTYRDVVAYLKSNGVYN